MQVKSVDLVRHCIGRHQVSVPGTFVAAPVAAGMFREAHLDKGNQAIAVVVEPMDSSRSALDNAIEKRREELSQVGISDVDVLTLEKQLSENLYLFRVHQIDDAFSSELLLWSGGALVALKVDSFEHRYEAAEKRLLELAASISQLRPEEPDSKGKFCLGNVSIAGDFSHESASFSFANRTGEAFDIYIDTFARDDSTTLLSRITGPNSLLTAFKVDHRVIKSGERIVANMRAQEWLGAAKVRERGESLQFIAETMRDKGGKQSPSIHLEFETGRALKDGTQTVTSLSDEEAIHLWEQVITSIRAKD